MPQRKATVQLFYFSRCEIEDEFEKLFERTNFRERCKKCSNCSRAGYVDFEGDRKMFYRSNKDVKDRKIRWQGRIKRLVISPVF